MNNLLPIYFENCKPTLPSVDQLHNVRKPVLHLPEIKHKFSEQLPDYQLVKLLKKNRSFRISSKFSHIQKKDLVLIFWTLSMKHMTFNVI